MSLIEKFSAIATKGLTSAETVRLPYDELAQIVTKEFIAGADDTFLAQVKRTAKGGFVFPKKMKSINENYEFHVGTRPNGLLWLNSKPVWIFDHEANKFYQLDKNLKWKQFYNAVKAAIIKEKTDHNR